MSSDSLRGMSCCMRNAKWKASSRMKQNQLFCCMKNKIIDTQLDILNLYKQIQKVKSDLDSKNLFNQILLTMIRVCMCANLSNLQIGAADKVCPAPAPMPKQCHVNWPRPGRAGEGWYLDGILPDLSREGHRIDIFQWFTHAAASFAFRKPNFCSNGWAVRRY